MLKKHFDQMNKIKISHKYKIKKNDRVIKNTTNRVLLPKSIMAEKVDTSSASTDVAEHFENEVAEDDVNNEPEWYRDGDVWVKIFLEPIAPGKFKQFDHVYSVPGENEFPIERWSSEECIDGFHITRREDVWLHLTLHGYKSAYIAEVVSMGDEFYDNLIDKKRKVRVVAFGPAVPLGDVLGKHLDDFKNGHMVAWSVVNNHIELVKLAVSKKSDMYNYDWAFAFALENENDQIAEFLLENCKNNASSQEMLNNAIRYGRTHLVKRLMKTTPVDVSFLRVACSRGQFEIFELLCDKYGEPKCGDIVISALCGGNVKILNYLKIRGVDMTDFEMFVYVCTYYLFPVETVKYLVSAGAYVTHPLVEYIAKRNACNDDVCEYLLTQIDERSEVPRCEELEAKIGEICNIFNDRIVMCEL
jgi:hypothetical protein